MAIYTWGKLGIAHPIWSYGPVLITGDGALVIDLPPSLYTKEIYHEQIWADMKGFSVAILAQVLGSRKKVTEKSSLSV